MFFFGEENMRIELNPEFCKLDIQTVEGPICKNHNPCGTVVFDFAKRLLAI
jgi:hypothetical protein